MKEDTLLVRKDMRYEDAFLLREMGSNFPGLGG